MVCCTSGGTWGSKPEVIPVPTAVGGAVGGIGVTGGGILPLGIGGLAGTFPANIGRILGSIILNYSCFVSG